MNSKIVNKLTERSKSVVDFISFFLDQQLHFWKANEGTINYSSIQLKFLKD